MSSYPSFKLEVLFMISLLEMHGNFSAREKTETVITPMTTLLLKLTKPSTFLKQRLTGFHKGTIYF